MSLPGTTRAHILHFLLFVWNSIGRWRILILQPLSSTGVLGKNYALSCQYDLGRKFGKQGGRCFQWRW